MKVHLSLSRDGRILLQGRIEQDGILGDLLHYVGQGEHFMGISYEDFAQATPGTMELPNQPDMTEIEPEQPPEENSEQA